MKRCVSLLLCLAEFFLEWKMLGTIFFFFKSCYVWDNVEKCGTLRQAVDGNVI
jgi:hypothetical protein